MNNDMNFNGQQSNQQYQNFNNNTMNNQQNSNGYQNNSNQNNQMQNLQQRGPKKNGTLKIVLIVIAVIVAIFFVTKLFGGSSSSGKTVNSGKEITVKNNAYNLTISVGDVQRGVVYTNDGTLSSAFNLDGTYTKAKVTIKNNNNKEEEISSYILPINLMDSSKTKITYCSYGEVIQDKNLQSEKLPEIIPANSTISGYVYCQTDSTAGTILNVNVPSSVSENNTGGYSVKLDDYYFNLN